MLGPLIGIMLAVVNPQTEGDAISLASLLEAHESSLGLIHEIELTLNVTAERFKPDHAGPVQIGIWRWAWNAPLERVRYVHPHKKPREDGLPVNRGDVFRDEATIKQLKNWDPENPQSIWPRNQGTVRARVWPRSRNIVGRDPRVALLFSFDVSLRDQKRYSLRELVEKSKPPATCVGVAAINGRACYQVHASVPSPKGESFGKASFDVFLDPSAGFLARRVDVEQRTVHVGQEYAGGRDTVYDRFVRDVIEFKACGGGVFVPTKVELRHYNEGEEGDPFSRVSFVATDLVVNQALSPDAFDFRFPENSLVVYAAGAAGGQRKAELWGPDNKPVKEITSPGDLPPGVPSSPQVDTGELPARVLLVSGGFVLLLILSVILYRRRSMKV